MLKFLICLLIPFTGLFAQNKLEREYRVKSDQVPPEAIECIQKFNFAQQVKWYFEEGLNGKSYEAKTEYRKQNYSIEFDTLGNLLDVEILIGPELVTFKVLQKINMDLNQRFKKHNVDRIQVQYTGTVEDVFLWISQNQSNNLTTKYELVIKSGGKLFEILFSDQGDFEQIAEIIPKNSFHLEF